MEAVHGIKGHRQNILANKSPWTTSAPRPSSCTALIFPNALTVISQQGYITRPCIRHYFITRAQKAAFQLQPHSTHTSKQYPGTDTSIGVGERFLKKQQIKGQRSCRLGFVCIQRKSVFLAYLCLIALIFCKTLCLSAQTSLIREGTMSYVNPQVCVYVHIELRYGVFRQ